MVTFRVDQSTQRTKLENPSFKNVEACPKSVEWTGPVHVVVVKLSLPFLLKDGAKPWSTATHVYVHSFVRRANLLTIRISFETSKF